MKIRAHKPSVLVFFDDIGHLQAAPRFIEISVKTRPPSTLFSRVFKGLVLSLMSMSYMPSLAEGEPTLRLAKTFPQLLGRPRSSLVVFARERSAPGNSPRMAHVTVDPLDKGGHLIWFQDANFEEASIAPEDRIVITEDDYGDDSTVGEMPPSCFPKDGIRIETRGRIALLASCDRDVTARIPPTIPAVSYREAEATLESMSYVYSYKKSNHMLFDRVSVKGNHPADVAFDSDLLIRSDVKNFFTMQFDSSDIESKMNHVRHNTVASLATLDFYLRILFFKITLDLQTDVSFYGNSAHIPMVLTVPVNAKKFLNPKSGVLYSFSLAEGVSVLSPVQVPALDPGTIQKNGLDGGHCLGDPCRYELALQVAGKNFVMRLEIPRRLVNLGMFPQFVADVGAEASKMGWSLQEYQKKTPRIGLYFEMSGLPEGEHGWDFWLLAGKNSD